MELISRLTNSVLFWTAWIVIPIIMEIIPAIGSIFTLRKRKIFPLVDKKPILYPEITIIIPVYNSQDTLEACIRSVYDSDYPNSRINIYLVNNKSQDRSFQVYTACQEKFPDLVMHWMNAEQGKSRALNLALYNSNGKYIIHIDSDGVLEKTALRHMVERFESNPTVSVMTGAICTNPNQIEQYPAGLSRLFRKLEFMEYAQAFLAGRNYASERDAIYTLSGAFSGFRKMAILKSWLYSTDTICEDTQITFQMKYIQKEKVSICEKAIFFVDPIENFDKLYTQRQRWQRGSLEVAKLFAGTGLHPGKIGTDVNVRTLMYDHTFAFPRLIWYVALICLLFLGFSGRTIGLSMAAIFGMYFVIGYFYFAAILGFLNEFHDLKSYYRKQWWVIPLLPFFNFMVFFIRMIGIINTIGTDSAWKTATLTQERERFKGQLKDDLKIFRKAFQGVKRFLNSDTPRDTSVRKWRSGGFFVVGLGYLIGLVLLAGSYWIKHAYGIGLGELVPTLLSPTKGTAGDVVLRIAAFMGSVILVFFALYVLLCLIIKKRKHYFVAQCGMLLGMLGMLTAGMVSADNNLKVLDYLLSRAGKSSLYEAYFVKPEEVAITAGEKTKNLIYLYVESLETTYASKEDGGNQDINYMPYLTELARTHTSFSDKEGLGGFRCASDTGITMAALFATNTGAAYGAELIQAAEKGPMAPGVTALGDILKQYGYRQEFLCGSDATFGNRRKFFEEHGGYEIFDLFTAREKKYIPEDYFVWWGFEDQYLFEIAKDEILRLSKEEEPFNFTFLTVDTHHMDGYICGLCEEEYQQITANVVSCTDRQIQDFVQWFEKQDFYEDTVLVITGDHPRMDTSLVEGVEYRNRTIYNCFVNSAASLENEITNREFTTMDIFPTVLSSLGFQIEGERLGLGTNLFSGEETLAEMLGFDELSEKLSFKSDFYDSYMNALGGS